MRPVMRASAPRGLNRRRQRLFFETLEPRALLAALTAAPGTASLDEDTIAGVAIPIIPLVTKNAGAPLGAIELREFLLLAGSGVVSRFDPNNTPADFTDDQLQFIPATNFNGTAKFTYTAGIVGDALPADAASNTITVTIVAVNDVPVNMLPATQAMWEDGAPVFSAGGGNKVAISDVDADPVGVLVTLEAKHGTLTLATTSGIFLSTGDGNADAELVFTGTTIAINAALNGILFKPTKDFVGEASFSIATNDLGNTGPTFVSLEDRDTLTINVAGVNDAPVIAAPSSQTVNSVNSLVFCLRSQCDRHHRRRCGQRRNRGRRHRQQRTWLAECHANFRCHRDGQRLLQRDHSRLSSSGERDSGGFHCSYCRPPRRARCRSWPTIKPTILAWH